MAQDGAATSTLHSTNSICHIGKLPNELLSHIFDHLNSAKPSDILNDEPTFEISNSSSADLKSVSRVTHRWRNLSIPVLFKHARLVASDWNSKRPMLNKQIAPFLQFIQSHSLQKAVTSFTLIVRHAINGEDKEPTGEPWIRTFWHSLFEVVDPLELLIVAHPAILGPLTSCRVSLIDAWNFDCPCHYFRLRRPNTPSSSSGLPTRSKQDSIATNSLEADSPDTSQHPSAVFDNNVTNGVTASQNPGLSSNYSLEPWNVPRAQSSVVFEIRSWTSFLLNEGSFIRSYAAYEFWLRQPPSVGVNNVGKIANANKNI
jgi:hypothetical protein